MPKPKSFTSWLKTHTDQRNAIGDLARDVAADPNWPSRKGRQGQLAYLEEEYGAIPAAVEALDRAWDQYEAYRATPSDA
ncbi:YozE family protein [Streptomyces luteocolor]|uniref:YozE family protein n=1 Tax=Streptomyces luteocolor TaxID=285500 RepID=UPI0008529773|nr:YozE family protein [Streptomyces luteocolor]